MKLGQSHHKTKEHMATAISGNSCEWLLERWLHLAEQGQKQRLGGKVAGEENGEELP